MNAAHEANQHLASNFQEAGDLSGVETHVGNRRRKDFESSLGVSFVEGCELFEFEPGSSPSDAAVGLSMVVDITLKTEEGTTLTLQPFSFICGIRLKIFWTPHPSESVK